MALTQLTNLIFEPKGKHDPTHTYDIMDVVMSEDGTRAYFALQNVPADIPITNEEYWILMIDLSGMSSGGGGGGIIAETDPTVPAWAKQPTKPTYTAEEVGALPADTVIPGGSAEDEYEVIAKWTAPAAWNTNMYTWNGFSCKKLIVIVEATAGTANLALEFLHNYDSLCYAGSGVISGSPSKTVCFIDSYLINDEDQRYRYIRAKCTGSGFNANTAQHDWVTRGFGLPGTITLDADSAIDRIGLRVNAGTTLPEGTVVTILGVRA